MVYADYLTFVCMEKINHPDFLQQLTISFLSFLRFFLSSPIPSPQYHSSPQTFLFLTSDFVFMNRR